MNDRALVSAFWRCGDNQIIEFAIQRARLNRKEAEVIRLMLDECYTQEEIAEMMNYSVRRVQNFWYSACDKLLSIPWVVAYAHSLN